MPYGLIAPSMGMQSMGDSDMPMEFLMTEVLSVWAVSLWTLKQVAINNRVMNLIFIYSLVAVNVLIICCHDDTC